MTSGAIQSTVPTTDLTVCACLEGRVSRGDNEQGQGWGGGRGQEGEQRGFKIIIKYSSPVYRAWSWLRNDKRLGSNCMVGLG